MEEILHLPPVFSHVGIARIFPPNMCLCTLHIIHRVDVACIGISQALSRAVGEVIHIQLPSRLHQSSARLSLFQSGSTFQSFSMLFATKTSIVTPLYSQASTNPNIYVAVLPFQLINSNSYCILSIHKYPPIPISTWLYSPSNKSILTPTAYSQ